MEEFVTDEESVPSNTVDEAYDNDYREGHDAYVNPSSTTHDLQGTPSSTGNMDERGSVVEEPVQTPTIGMVFKSWLDVEAMYKLYGKAHGFGVARTQASFNVNRERRGMTWKCECWGVPNMKQKREMKKREEEMAIGGSTVVELPKVRRRKSKKCDCHAMIYASVNREELWEVNKVVLEHNGHDPKPDDSRLVKEYRMQSFTSNMRRRVLNDVEVGVPIDQIHGSVARERDGLANMPVTPKDMRHVADKARKLKVEGGDAVALMKYLDRMRRDNNEFFYSIRMDVTGGLQDVFWVDARSKAAYEEFGDVVCFDTTYMTNEYELPFANFVGVNHHSQTTLFGCALMSHEDKESFTWVFDQWLQCMGGKAPDAILTDQAAAMRKPIAETMPDTTHRWCLWHIMQKVPLKLGGYSKYKQIKKALKAVIYNSFSPSDFERRWKRVIRKYKIRRNEWLCELYEDRKMWVPAYLREIFWAGMRTTQRVESIHSFFDKFVKSHTKLIEFGEKYIAAVEKRMCQERDADDRDRKWHRDPSTKFALELYFASIYTDEKFVEVSQQCERVSYGFVSRETQLDEEHIEYVINDPIWVYKEGCRSDILTEMRRLYHLVYNVNTCKAVCDCRMFETNGIMCRHIIRVLYQNGVTVPPDMYVLHRWKKNVDRKHTRIRVAYHDPRRTEEVRRLDKMQVVFDILSDKACWHEVRTAKVIDTLTKLIPEVEGLHDDPVHSEPEQDSGGAANVGDPTQSQSPYNNWQCNGNVSQTLRDPVKRKKRGRPKGSRMKGVAEVAIKKSHSKRSNKKVSETSSSSSVETDGIPGTVSPKGKSKKATKRPYSSTSDSYEAEQFEQVQERRRRGRPRGSKSKSQPTHKGNSCGTSTNHLHPSRYSEDVQCEEAVNSRPKRGTLCRKRTRKRLEDNLHSSSDDLSLSF